MKKRFLFFTVIITLLLILVPACSASTTANGASGSLKAITKPYIGEYECVAARLGESDLLEKYEFIKITLLDDEKMEVSFKPKGGAKRVSRAAIKSTKKRANLRAKWVSSG